MHYKRFSWVVALAALLGVAVSTPAYAQARMSNLSDVSGNLLTGSNTSTGFEWEWATVSIDTAVQETVVAMRGGGFGGPEVVTVGGNSEFGGDQQIALSLPDGRQQLISFGNGELIAQLIDSAYSEAGVSQDLMDNAIASFLKGDPSTLDPDLVRLATNLAEALSSFDEKVTPLDVMKAINAYNRLIQVASEKNLLDQLGDGLYGAYAAITLIINKAEAASLIVPAETPES
jgi:hypothetical protein